MSDTAKRDAVLAEYRIDRTAPVVPGVMRVIAGHDGLAMADEIVRLRAENTALKSAVERVRAACENELRWIDAQPILRALEGTA